MTSVRRLVLAFVVLYSAFSVRVTSAQEEPKLQQTEFMTGLERPWDMAFLPDGSMLYTELCRGLSIRLKDGATKHLFGSTGSSLAAPDLVCESQSGMNGVAVDPEFYRNRFIYVYMASNLLNPITVRVVRLALAADNASVSHREDIISDVPFKTKANAWGEAGAHIGGRLRFGPDGFLWLTTGDNHNGSIPQDVQSLGGKVLRFMRDGRAAPGNTPPADGDPRIFTYGHRNVQGLTFHPVTGQAFIAEHGPKHHDEVTPLWNGRNGGWDPRPEKDVSCADDYCGYISNKKDGTPTPMTDAGKFPNAMPPIWDNNGKSEGLCPAEFLKGSKWKAWDGSLVIGYLASKRIEILTLNKKSTVASVAKPAVPAARIRATVLGPDGDLYIATDEGAIWKVTPE